MTVSKGDCADDLEKSYSQTLPEQNVVALATCGFSCNFQRSAIAI